MKKSPLHHTCPPKPWRRRITTSLPHHVTLAVIAGGRGVRMGKPKAWLRLGGQPVLQHLLDKLDWSGPTLLVTAPGLQRPPGWRLFKDIATDPVPGQGPLRGLLTALEHAKTSVVLAIPVDMPNLDAAMMEWFISQLQSHPTVLGIMARRGQSPRAAIEPFPCAIRRSARRLLKNHLALGRRSLHSLLEHDSIRAVGAPRSRKTVWLNLNLPGDVTGLP